MDGDIWHKEVRVMPKFVHGLLLCEATHYHFPFSLPAAHKPTPHATIFQYHIFFQHLIFLM